MSNAPLPDDLRRAAAGLAPVQISRLDLDTLLAVARLYLDAFKDDELMSGTQKLALQDVEKVVARYQRPDEPPVRPGEEPTP